MGKRLRQQRRGKGSKAYTKPPGTFDLRVNYSSRLDAVAEGEVMSIFNHTGHTAPLMQITYDDFTSGYMIAPEGIKVRDRIYTGKRIFTIGSVMRIGDIPEGLPVYNIESTPGDGGKFVRSAGST